MRAYSQDYTHWFEELFPQSRWNRARNRKPNAELWPQAARDLADGLLRRAKLAALEGGLELNRTSQSFDVRVSIELNSQSQQRELVSPQAWLMRSGGVTSQVIVQWCDPQLRGIYSEAFQLGRQRASTPADLQLPPWGLAITRSRRSTTPTEATKAEVRAEADGRQRLVLITPHNAEYQLHYVIDTTRNVLVAIESHVKGRGHRHDEVLRLCRGRRHVVGHKGRVVRQAGTPAQR